jgi:hypothetical protein
MILGNSSPHKLETPLQMSKKPNYQNSNPNPNSNVNVNVNVRDRTPSNRGSPTQKFVEKISREELSIKHNSNYRIFRKQGIINLEDLILFFRGKG